MTEVQIDPAQPKHIEYSEEYRRAKRNSLIWSGLTILIGVGSSTSENKCGQGSFSVAPFATGMCYPTSVVTIVLFIISTYIFIEYLRANRALERKNSQALMGKKAESVAQAFTALSDAAHLSNATTVEHYSKLNDQIINYSRNLSTRMHDLKVAIEGAIAYINDNSKSLSTRYNKSLQELDRFDQEALSPGRTTYEALSSARNSFMGFRGSYEETFNEFWPYSGHTAQLLSLLEVSRSELQESIPNLDAVGASVASSSSDLNSEFIWMKEAAAEFSTFHRDISKSETLWYILVDNLPVFITYSVGVLTCLVKMITVIDFWLNGELVYVRVIH